MALLGAIPLTDLRRCVVVDYGTGAWGFAAVYPALHQCARRGEGHLAHRGLAVGEGVR